MGAVYRIRQGFANLGARMHSEDWALVEQQLSKAERELFEQMEPADQHHSVRVLRALLGLGITDQDILKAALLHDVGKSGCRISLLHRTLAVLWTAAVGISPAFQLRSNDNNNSWWLPFYVLANHPRLGASMLVRVGTKERVWRLVELHQLEPRLVGDLPDASWVRAALATLRIADNQN